MFEAGFDDRELIPQDRQLLGFAPVKWIQEAIADEALDRKPDSMSPVACNAHCNDFITKNLTSVFLPESEGVPQRPVRVLT